MAPFVGGTDARELRRRCRQLTRLHIRSVASLVCCSLVAFVVIEFPTFAALPDAFASGALRDRAAWMSHARDSAHRRVDTALTARQAEDERTRAEARKPPEEFKIGDDVTGQVDSFWKNFAVMLDVGARKRGMLSIEEFTDGFPLEGWPPKKGTELTARVLSKNADGTFTLTRRNGDLKRSPPPPKTQKRVEDMKLLKLEDWYDATVNGFSTYGVFLSVTPPGGQTTSGLLPISEFADGFAATANRGSSVKVRVLDLDLVKKRVTFTSKEK